MRLPLLVPMLAPAAFLLLSGCDPDDFVGSNRFQEDFHSTHPLEAGGRLSLDNANGAVEITGWDRNEVDVAGTKYASSRDTMNNIRIDVSESSAGLAIRTIFPSGRHGNAGARYVLRVPRRVTLDRIVSSNGGIRVEDVEGSAQLRSSNGAIHVNRMKGPLQADTSNGAIRIEEHRGDVEAVTSNGRIQADASGGGFRAETSNSGIEVTLRDPRQASPVRLNSSNGSIALAIEGGRVPPVTAGTSNSGIELRLPASASARIHASTSSSSITSDFELTMPPGARSKNKLDGTIGGGGPAIDLETSNGSIRILKQL